MYHDERVFGETPFEYNKIITCIFIGGLTDTEIAIKLQNESSFPVMKCLFCYPQSETKAMDQIPFEFLYPNEQYELSSPKYFSMTFTNEKGIRSYIYCFKLSEVYHGDNGQKTFLPLVIGIKSYKPDIYAIKDLFEKIYQIMNKDNPDGHLSDEVFNYKKVELLNLFAFCTQLIKPSPHTNIRLQFNNNSNDKADFNENNTLDMPMKIMKHIDFYYSSNCEIPCNKNDSDINVIFTILDLEIIIKLVISILSERQILIIASDASLLFNIFPALLKLIFPFKWIHAYLPMLPNDQFEILQAPVSYLIGILSLHKENPEIKELIETNDSRVIVDCDSNQIFGYVEYPSYIFHPLDEKNTSERLIYIDQSEVYGYDLNKKAKTQLSFPKKISKVIIDCENNKMLYARHRDDDFDEDWTSLRQKLQLAKNPCIFNLDDFSVCQKKPETKIGDIKIDRPFSYNVQNIFLHFYKLKIDKYNEEIEDTLINTIKHTNLFENFTNFAIYQNDSGAIVFKNIFEVKEERSYRNCFQVCYIFPEFPVKKLVSDLKEKNIIISETIEKRLNDYCKVKHNENSWDNKSIFNHWVIANNRKKEHKKKMKSLLQKSHEMNTLHFNQLAHGDDQREGEPLFTFYNKNGFIAFANEFFDLFANNTTSFLQLWYENQILSDIVFSVKKVLEEIRMIEMNNEEGKQCQEHQRDSHQLQNQLNSIQEEKEENGEDIPRESYRLTKHNFSAGMNIPFEEDNIKTILDYNDELTKLQYYLFLAYTLETIADTYTLFKEKYNLNASINSIILQLYIKAYSIDQKDFPLYRFSLFMELYLNSLNITDTVKLSIDNPILIKYKSLYQIASKLISNKKAKEMQKKAELTINDFDTISSINQTYCIIDNTINPFHISPKKENLTFTEGDTITKSKITSSYSINAKTEEYYQKIIINNKINFNPQLKPMSYNIINQMGEMISACLLSISNGQEYSPYIIINQLSDQIANFSIKELVAELAELDLSSIKHTGNKIAFWLNCYNYLLIFTLFYKKWIISKESDWKFFFKNVYYIIGKKEVSFIDMQYIILGKVLFFDGSLKSSESIKGLYIGKIKNWRLLGLLLYFPTGITLKPKVYNAIDFEKGELLIEQFKEYLNQFVKLEIHQKYIYIPEFLSFIDVKWIDKLNKIIPDEIAVLLKGMKKKVVITSWLMDFSFLV